ncbi:MAG: translation initiation factor IF-1 [Sandaracinaceae bacterium]|nr:translation initiation factor IF-1 [Sandaracinaceae bacterium]
MSTGKEVGGGKEVEGVVLETLPQGLFKVQLDDGSKVTVSFGGVARQVTVKVSPGDRVAVLLSPFDPTRGSIKQKKA